MGFNRKERLQISKKIVKQRGGKGRRLSNRSMNWRLVNLEKRKQRERQTIGEYEARKNDVNNKDDEHQHEGGELKSSRESNSLTMNGKRTWYSLSVALPGTILDNVQTPELKTYLSGELARMFAIFCVDEVVVFDETAKVSQRDVDAFRDWTGKEQMDAPSTESVCFMARLLQFQECPQYLRKALFPLQRPLQFSALLNPLNALHHLRATELSFPFREGVVLDMKSKKGLLLCDVGLEKQLLLKTDKQIEPFTRVTVRMEHRQQSMTQKDSVALCPMLKQFMMRRAHTGDIQIAKSLSEVLSADDGTYDVVIGTSERGTPVDELSIPREPNSNCKILIVFGGLNGLEAAIGADPSIRGTDPVEYFQHYVNCLPGQGSRVIRTEEAIPIALTALKCKLDWTSSPPLA